MTVHLHAPENIPYDRDFDAWFAMVGCDARFDGAEPVSGLAERLERAFTESREDWWVLARTLQESPSARLAHAPVCNPGPSDLGAMLAWTRIVDALALDKRDILAVCEDPWLFRHLASRPGVAAGTPPELLRRSLKLWVRGYASRLRFTWRVAMARFKTRATRRNAQAGAPAIVVYGHPASRTDGYDAYFADLADKVPALRRLMHTNCKPERALELAADGRTASLHAWGGLGTLVELPFAKWRPSAKILAGPHGWIVRRAAALEGGGGAGAQSRWQEDCQDRWLRDTKPAVVVWPWESHPWERMLIASARASGVRSIGYQHTVVGRHMYNLSPSAMRLGEYGLPDEIAVNGPAFEQDLLRLGVPGSRMALGGALRFQQAEGPHYDSEGPVFVALPSAHAVARELVRATEAAAKARPDLHFRIREHPMYPQNFTATANLTRADGPLPREKALSCVVYTASTVGLEGILFGVPAVRYQPTIDIAMDILPVEIIAETCDAEALAKRLPPKPLKKAVTKGEIFADPQWDYWQDALGVASEGTPQC